jgi:replicative DNA helicase
MEPQKSKPSMTWAKHPNGTMIGTPVVSEAVTVAANKILGKPMPSTKDIEQAVLGALLTDKDAFILAQSAMPISENDFYFEAHKSIFRAVSALGNAQLPIDLLTTIERLKADNALETAGGYYGIVELTSRVASAANLEYHCRILRQYAIKRGVIKACHEATEKAYREDVDCFDLLGDVQMTLSEQTDGMDGSEIDILKTTEAILREAADPNLSGSYMKTGYPNLDNALGGGISQEDYIVLLAGLPGSGKTAFCLNTIISNMENNEPTAFFSFDMSAKEILFRIISCKSGVNSIDMRRGRTGTHQLEILENTRQWVEQRAHLLTVISASGMRGNVMTAKMIALSKTKGITKFMIDYFTAIPLDGTSKFGTETQAQNTLVKSIKEAMQKIQGCAMILAQFTKAGASKETPLTLQDIKGTGELGEAASIAIIVTRDSEGSSGEFSIVKARNTPSQIVHATYFGACYRWDCGAKDSIDDSSIDNSNIHFDNFDF